MKRLAILALVAAAACGDNSNNPDAFQHADAPHHDSPIDGPAIDGPAIDTPTTDTPTVDTPTIDAMIDAPTIDAMIDAAIDAPIDAAADDGIATALGTADGTGLTLPITNVTVTYIKPQIGSTTDDPAGFTVQSMAAGPGLFVAVDPTTLAPMPTVGDVVSFTVTSMTTVDMERRANAVAAYTRSATGANVDALAPDISAATDVVSNLPAYDSRIVDVTGTITSTLSSGGSGFQKATISTAGMATVSTFTIRVPSTVADAIDLVNTCGFTLNNVPVNQFGTTAEISPYVAGDITLAGCPAPAIASATATAATTVQVAFTRNLLPASVTAADFTIDNGLTVSAAVLSGRTVTLTTSAQTPGTTYTVTVAGVTDLQGTMIGASATAMFSGFSMPATVRINELNANINSSCDLIELRVISGGALTSFKITERQGNTANNELNFVFPSMTVNTNDLLVLHDNSTSLTCNPTSATSETTSITQFPTATVPQNFDTAYDIWMSDNGLTATDNVITLYDPAGNIVDAVFVANTGTTIAAGTSAQAAVVGTANQWSPAQTSYTATDFHADAVGNLGGTGTMVTGTSIQRVNDADTNAAADWTTGAGATATWGVLNAGQTPF